MTDKPINTPKEMLEAAKVAVWAVWRGGRTAWADYELMLDGLAARIAPEASSPSRATYHPQFALTGKPVRGPLGEELIGLTPDDFARAAAALAPPEPVQQHGLVERVEATIAFAGPAELELTPLSQRLLADLRDCLAALSTPPATAVDVEELCRHVERAIENRGLTALPFSMLVTSAIRAYFVKE